MTMLLLAFLGGVLTILSPCILPVVPLVFARTGRGFARETGPMLLGLAAAFTAAAMIARATAHWLLVANEIGRDIALAMLAIVGLSLLSVRMAEWLTRPITRAGASLLGTGSATSPGRNVVLGMAIGLLWAPCAGPILGLLIAASATADAPHSAALFLTFAIGAAVSLAVVNALGARLLARFKRAGAADVVVRRVLGVATLITVVALTFGWDRALFANGGLVRTASAEELLVSRLAPQAAARPAPGGESLDAFAADETARTASIALPQADGQLAPFEGGTEWINSTALTPELLRGKVVLVDFWTFECYNCLNALPHVKELYAKYKDRGFVVVGVHTPEFARERVPGNVRREVAKLGITYPVVIDNDNRIWNAYHNQYWPAAYFADATGKMRFYHFGEGRYEEQDKVVAKLLAERDANSTRGAH
jgi:cytochrome c biogenesis protein CcdA/thiol-disulfide isomerase/thioredoxin